MTQQKAELGMIGLGVMGRNLLLNMADHGFAVAGYDRDPEKVTALNREGEGKKVMAAEDLTTFLDSLQRPRSVMLLVPAGDAVDAVIDELTPHLADGDLIIDGGNSYFADTDRRRDKLEAEGYHYLGIGVSGGEEGARRGPSMMPGGSREAYARVQFLLETVAAKVGDDPCVAWLGPGAAGHYVKMVHNGIEYGLMQLIAESYDLMKRGLGLDNSRLQTIYRGWNEGDELNGFLMEITGDIFGRKDDRSDADLVDMILDAARQKGTGMWTSQQALALQVPEPNIALAVLMRDLSAHRDERKQAAELLQPNLPTFNGDVQQAIDALQGALSAAFLTTYAQGMALLQEASHRYDYGLQLETVARIWRGGCIIRASLLEDLRAAYQRNPQLANPLLDQTLAKRLLQRQDQLRQTVELAARLGVPAPGLMGALAYFDSYRSDRLPTNLIQAQRDYFGAHTYERIDTAGTFHTEWK